MRNAEAVEYLAFTNLRLTAVLDNELKCKLFSTQLLRVDEADIDTSSRSFRRQLYRVECVLLPTEMFWRRGYLDRQWILHGSIALM